VGRIVAKFGGSSVKDALAMSNCARLAVKRNARIIVSSATQGTTDELVALCDLEGSWKLAQERLKVLEARHLSIWEDLKASDTCLEKLNELFSRLRSLCHGIYLLNDCSPKFRDRILCFGELLSTTLLVEAFRAQGVEAEFLDARTFLKTSDKFGAAQPILEEIASHVQGSVLVSSENFIITQGFIGSTLSGSTTTLGRGGSDYSAALIAEAARAEHLEIWTDVAGVATTDPRLCPDARPISEISFREASELAAFGAKVLHPTTVWPSIRKGFPVFVGSSQHPEEGGTWIRSEVAEYPIIRAISVKKSQVFLTISTPEMSQTYGFLAKVFDVFRDHELSIDTVTTSEISIGVTLDEVELANDKLLQDLASLGKIEVERGLSLVSLVGNRIRHTPGLLESILRAINGVNLRSICAGASKHQVCFLVESEEAGRCVEQLHRSFISS